MHDDFYQMYLEEMGNIEPCSKEEQEALLKEAAKGKEEAKKRLIEGNLHNALVFAREFDDRGVLLTDLVQEANMGLIMAVESYIKGEPSLEFDRFLEESIREALELAIKEQQWAEQTGEELTARVNVLQQVSQGLAKELGREATVDELAHKMKMTEQEINGIMKMALDAMCMNAENMNLQDLEDLADVEGLEILEGREE